MKNYITALMCAGICIHANAADLIEKTCCMACTRPAGASYTYDTSCSKLCTTCTNSELTNIYGITTKITKRIKTICPTGTTGVIYGECETVSTIYSCADGYYGTADETGTTGCTKCPLNATCSGGNGSTFECTTGYYKNNDACYKCPAANFTSAFIIQGNTTKIYGTCAAGSDNISACYIIPGTYKDTSGYFSLTNNCQY